MQKYKPIASTSFSMQRTTNIAQLSRPTRRFLSQPVIAIAKRNSLNACFKQTQNAGSWRVLPSSSSPTSMRKGMSFTISRPRSLLVRMKRRTSSIWVGRMHWRASMLNTRERWGWAWRWRTVRQWCDLSRRS